MMVDYTAWIKQWASANSKWSPSDIALMVIILIFGTALAVALLLFDNSISGNRAKTVAATIVVAAMLLAISALFIVMALLHLNQYPESFIEHTQATFGVSRMECRIPKRTVDGVMQYDDCDPSTLPADKTPARWIDQKGNLVNGTILIDGNKVGLAGPDGKLIEPFTNS